MFTTVRHKSVGKDSVCGTDNLTEFVCKTRLSLRPNKWYEPLLNWDLNVKTWGKNGV